MTTIPKEESLMACMDTSTSSMVDDPWWIGDGTKSHITFKRELFSSFTSWKNSILVSNGVEYEIQGVRSILIWLESKKKAILESVLYVPSFPRNMLSKNQLVDKGCFVKIDCNLCFVIKEGKIISRGIRDGRLFKLNICERTNQVFDVKEAKEELISQEVVMKHSNIKSKEDDSQARILNDVIESGFKDGDVEKTSWTKLSVCFFRDMQIEKFVLLSICWIIMLSHLVSYL